MRSSKCRPTRRGPSWGKKDKHCQPTNPDDQEQGSYWDPVLLDTPSRLIVTLVIGRRTEETVYQAFTDFYQRTDGQLPALFTTDEYAAYYAAIVDTYSVPKEALELTEEQKAEFGWEEKRKLQGRLIDGRYHGVAVVCFIEGGGVGPKENARLELEDDGSVTVYVGAAAVGQGLDEPLAQQHRHLAVPAAVEVESETVQRAVLDSNQRRNRDLSGSEHVRPSPRAGCGRCPTTFQRG